MKRFLWLFLLGCQSPTLPTSQSPPPLRKPPHPFQSDSAYASIAKQLAIGFRVVGTPAHQACGNWLKSQLELYGLRVVEQKGTFGGTPIRNIIGSLHPDKKPRILLSAHWDTRPWADAHPSTTSMPVPGANDDASGVAVLLEVARLLAKDSSFAYGVDIAFWDAEDLGMPDKDDSYALGAQLWAQNPTPYPSTEYQWGIHLDMVGADNATFTLEGHSRACAPSLQVHIWQIAHQLGYANVFPYYYDVPITDDPAYICAKAKVPMINIIHRDITRGSFFPQWHTPQDDLEHISPKTLQIVGEVLLHVLYNPPKSPI
ncbi:MAG: M28 family peptidase [Bacteroidia bacterium]